MLLVGDGSGQSWDMGTGSACALIQRYGPVAELFWMATNKGTVSLAEMWPYLHAMLWYTSKGGPGPDRRREAVAAGRCLQIHIVTDSAMVATCGSHPDSRQAHTALWAAYDAFPAQGYALTFHHLKRSVSNLNILMDAVCGQARVDLKETKKKAIATLQKKYPGIPADAGVYDFF